MRHLPRHAAALAIPAVEIADSRVGDAPMPPGLPSQIPADVPTAPSRNIATGCLVGQWTAPMAARPAATPSRTEVPARSSRPGATPSR